VELARVLKGIPGHVAQSGLLDAMETLGTEVLWPLLLGSLLQATLLAFAAYHVALRWARRRQARLLREQVLAAAVQAPNEPSAEDAQVPAAASAPPAGPSLPPSAHTPDGAVPGDARGPAPNVSEAFRP
jgi:hypothetical protein